MGRFLRYLALGWRRDLRGRRDLRAWAVTWVFCLSLVAGIALLVVWVAVAVILGWSAWIAPPSLGPFPPPR